MLVSEKFYAQTVMFWIALTTLVMLLLLGQWLVLSFHERSGWQQPHRQLPASQATAYALSCIMLGNKGGFTLQCSC